MPSNIKTPTTLSVPLPKPVAISDDIRRLSENIFADAENLPVSAGNPDDVALFNQLLGRCTSFKSKVDAQRKKYIQPLKQFMDECMAQQKEIVAPIEELGEAIRTEINNYLRRQDEAVRKQNEARRIAEEEKQKETAGSGHVTQALVTPIDPEIETAQVSLRKIAVLHIDDMEKIPREFFVLDEVKLKNALIANSLAAPGGAHLTYESQVRSTGARG